MPRSTSIRRGCAPTSCWPSCATVDRLPQNHQRPTITRADPMSDQAKAELAPTGVLRAGINLSNFLLVTGKSASGDPEGVAPDMARAIADKLGVPVKYVPFPKPG